MVVWFVRLFRSRGGFHVQGESASNQGNRRSLHSATHPSSKAAGDPGRSGRDDKFVARSIFAVGTDFSSRLERSETMCRTYPTPAAKLLGTPVRRSRVSVFSLTHPSRGGL